MARIFNSVDYDLLYLDSQFAPRYTIVPLLLRKLKWIPRKPLLLATRGQCAPAALALKRQKKKAFLFLARCLGLYSGITFQATAAHEETDIRNCWGEVPMVLLPTLGPAPLRKPPSVEKRRGDLRLLFVGRICKMKNLLWGLQTLQSLPRQGQVELSIYGPIEEHDYWRQCLARIKEMPPHVKVSFHGPLHPSARHSVLQRHHCFYSPTSGENYGHAIAEALAAGLPLLISDRTPWRGLEAQGAGWDLPLQTTPFQTALLHLLQMDQEGYDLLAEGTLGYAKRELTLNQNISETLGLFSRLTNRPVENPHTV